MYIRWILLLRLIRVWQLLSPHHNATRGFVPLKKQKVQAAICDLSNGLFCL